MRTYFFASEMLNYSLRDKKIMTCTGIMQSRQPCTKTEPHSGA
ncbi:hypothetical protein HMPREF0880_04537 [Yokenella regensburgei ATCC 43003]|nr:hypothetical protein HMPREF0880_04537 [Yokenella regensburgei ATCC 43003]